MSEKITVDELHQQAYQEARKQWPVSEETMADMSLLMTQAAVWQSFAAGAAYGYEVLVQAEEQASSHLSDEEIEQKVKAFQEWLGGAPEASEPGEEGRS